MALVADANADAFAVLYDRHVKAAYSLAYRICGDRASADDACQDGMLAVWRGAGQYRAHLGSARSWILTVVHRRAIDHVRRRARVDGRLLHDDGAAEILPAGEDVEAEAMQREQRREVRGLLDALAPEQREVLRLGYYGGFSQTEIAELLDLPLGTVKGRMRLALARLRRTLEAAEAGRA